MDTEGKVDPAAGAFKPDGRKRGQPTRYSETLRAVICRDIEQGVPVYKAFVCNGISPRTGFNWTHRRPEFALAVEAARVRYQRRWHPML